MTGRAATEPPAFAGRIGVTLLCIYLLVVTLRIGGCYRPDAGKHDELPDNGPAVGREFPGFTLHDVSGATVGRDELRGTPAIVIVAPSLDWSPPTKARLLDLAEIVQGCSEDPHQVVFLPNVETLRRFREK